MHNCSNVQNQSQNSLTKKHRSNDVFHMNHNNLIDSQIHHDPNSNVTFHQKIQKHHHVPPPVSSNMQLVNSSSSSVRRVHSSNDSVTPHHPQQSKDIPTFDGTRTSTTFLTSSHPNANDSPIAQNDHHVNNVGQQNYHHQQTLITNELTRYALTRKYIYDISNFPPLPTAQVLTNNPMMIKLDDLMTKMSEIKDQISNVALKYEKFEQFILEKNQNDKRIEEHLDTVTKNTVALKKDVVQHSLSVERHENLFMKVLLPIFEDLFTVICTQNQDKKGNPLDADLKYKLERYRVQMKKASE
ncbi:unnamed protein product, partial [Rotaria sordida]